jgi:hypothetical protein
MFYVFKNLNIYKWAMAAMRLSQSVWNHRTVFSGQDPTVVPSGRRISRGRMEIKSSELLRNVWWLGLFFLPNFPGEFLNLSRMMACPFACFYMSTCLWHQLTHGPSSTLHLLHWRWEMWTHDWCCIHFCNTSDETYHKIARFLTKHHHDQSCANDGNISKHSRATSTSLAAAITRRLWKAWDVN